MKRIVLLLAILATPVHGRTSLGTFDGWGAFRDERPYRCFAIAEPVRGRGGAWRPFASVATWPQAGVRGQVHIRLGREAVAGSPVTLTVGGRSFALVAGGADAWTADPRVDAAIVAAMRNAASLTIRARAKTGRLFSDRYVLKGAATAIDAAALGCSRR